MSQMSDPKHKPGSSELQNEGEGSRSAARRYDAGAEKAAKDPEHVKKAAKEAADALEGAEAKVLKEAEKRGKKHQHR